MDSFEYEVLQQSTTTLGTADYNLTTAVLSYKTFRQMFANGANKICYAVRNKDNTKWEINRFGTLTYGAPDTLSRNTIRSTSSNAPVTWVSDDLPLTIYVSPNVADVLEGTITGWLATVRNGFIRFGQWFKKDDIAANKHTLRIYDGTQDILIGWVDGVGHTAVVFAQPAGTMLDYSGADTVTPPPGYLFCIGQNVSRTTYPALFAALTRSATVTMTIASPCVVTWNAHPLVNGDKVSFETTGALPTGLAVGVNYFVINKAANTFNVAATLGGAAINTSGSQSGVHTCRHNPHGCGDGSTTFTIPDMRGRGTVGHDPSGTAARVTNAGSGIDSSVIGEVGGDQLAQSHNHTGSGAGIVGNNLFNGTSRAVGTADGTNSGYFQDIQISINTSLSGGAQNMPPSYVATKIIATGGVL